jgi:pimeloyl-ACP methyl ester carboxylesterase
MAMKSLHTIAPLLVLVFVATVAGASDTAKEKRWADQIVDGIFDGAPEWLETDGQRFLAIYTPARDDKPRGAAIVLHGIGVHPDWPQVVNPLRVQLPARGWATLSVQMPILANEADARDYVPLFKEVAPRIDAGIGFLQARGVEPIVIVAHSLGAAMGSYYLAAHPAAPIKAFVGIGMSGNRTSPELDNVVSLAKMKLPVLDLYGSDDLEAVVGSAADRAAAAARAGNSDYEQQEIAGANHFFDGREGELVNAVAEWLTASH